ncbi:hypothetical protein BC940DRAFT_290521 [Gongronella butleri]|nr:hypothetical protein BC940DRAFT_290521 [Gongronella butleri]
MVHVEPKTFANHFWGKDDTGYYALSAKMTNAKRTFEDLKAFYSARAAIHEEVGKRLIKQLKTELGRDETGTLGTLLATAYHELEATANANLELAGKIRTNLEVQLDNFILEHKDKRKLVQTNVDRAHRNKQLHATHLAKAKEKYEVECNKLVTFEGQLATAMGKDAERLQQKLQRCKFEMPTLEQEYKSACTKLAEATRIWDAEWKTACDRYQEMEEKRIDFLRHSFSLYVNILSTNNSHEQESFERFWKSIEQCDVAQDISTIIDEQGTGGLIPDPPIYVHYMDDSTKTLPTFHSAQFAPATPIEPVSTAIPNMHTGVVKTAANGTKKPVASQKPNSYANKPIPKNSADIKHGQQHATSSNASASRTVKQETHPAPSNAVPRITKRLPSLKRTPLSQVTREIDELPLQEQKQAAGDDPAEQQDEDIEIDPRAKVVFTIGNNVFNIDQPLQTPRASRASTHGNSSSSVASSSSASSASHRRSIQPASRRDRRSVRDDDHAFDASIKELLEELGVKPTDHATKSERQSYESASSLSSASTYQRHLPTRGDSSSSSSTFASSSAASPQQPSMYSQLQQNYYAGMANTNAAPACAVPTQPPAQPASIPPTHHPQAMALHEGILSWARALYDHPGSGDCLGFMTGTWLAIHRVENESWCLASIWDHTTESLSRTKGYVPRNLIQMVA